MSAEPPKAQRIQVGGSSLYKTGTSRFDWRDPYHLAMTAGWPWFFVGFVALFIFINLVFAGLYCLDPAAINNVGGEHVLRDAFFFSMETLATVGYGTMSPASTYGHVVAAVEIICGLAFTAITTGLIFVRFSKVRPRMLFADKLVVHQHDGKPTLMLRLAYGRTGTLGNVGVRLHVLGTIKTAEGRTFRVIRELVLQRPHQPLLVLTWTVMHTIDEHSPLHGMNQETVVQNDMRVFCSLQARDHELNSEIHATKTYAPVDIRYGMVYSDLVTNVGTNAISVDVRRLSEIQPE